MHKSFLLAVFALIVAASANSITGNIISRRLNVGGERETKRNSQAIPSIISQINSTLIGLIPYTSIQYCSSTKEYYYSKLYICIPEKRVYEPLINPFPVPKYCSYTKEFYYSEFYVCEQNPSQYTQPQYCSYTGLDYYSKFYICIPHPIEPSVEQASNMIGAIIGGIVGGIILIIVSIVIFFYCCQKKNVNNQPIGVAVSQEQRTLTQSGYMPQQMTIQPQCLAQPIIMNPHPMMMQETQPIDVQPVMIQPEPQEVESIAIKI